LKKEKKEKKRKGEKGEKEEKNENKKKSENVTDVCLHVWEEPRAHNLLGR
jgi:hypothetical protein